MPFNIIGNSWSQSRGSSVGDPCSSSKESSSYSTKGSYGLYKCHEGSNAVADVVFVHGLTGNRETTWTDKESGVFWPAHLLKEDVPNTRIVTFGYDADVVHFWAAASQNRIRNHASNLVNALAQLRERTKTEERPIVFVTHSLGGLVFEDAMSASKGSAESHLQKIYNSTVGVCFMGTPHCGSDLANWASVLGHILNTLVKKTNSSLLTVLEPESEVLARIQSEFHTMLRNRASENRPPLNITCFYEELPVKGAGEIVPRHSAILPAYNSIGIHGNHMEMTRFSSDEDPGYLSVSSELRRWVTALGMPSSSNMHPSPYSSATTPAALEWHSGQGYRSPPALSDGRQQQFLGDHGSVMSGIINNRQGGIIMNGSSIQGNIHQHAR